MELCGKKIAAKKQIAFKKNVLKLTNSGKRKNIEYETILDISDASKGYNFFCYNTPEWLELQKWAHQNTGQEKKTKVVNFLGEGLRNMLRSEHIPYNMFFPLAKSYTTNPDLVIDFFEKLITNDTIDEITKFKIEYVSELDKKKLLNDNTSFDAYVEYLSNGKKCGLGIELKYTEKSYPFGIREKDNFNNPDSLYNILANKSECFNDTFFTIDKETIKKEKQLLRNHLLGLRLVEMGELDKFYSIHIYPKGNIYQKQACNSYTDYLSEKGKQSFVPVEFEKFIATAYKVFGYQKWIDYLDNRYPFYNN